MRGTKPITKFTIIKQDHWYVIVPTILRSFHNSREPDWYCFDSYDAARRFVASKLTYSSWRRGLKTHFTGP